MKSLNAPVHMTGTRKASVLWFRPTQLAGPRSLTFAANWHSAVGMISGRVDSARLVRNQKPHNSWVKRRRAATRKTSPGSELFVSLLDEQGEKVCLGERGWKAGLWERDFCFILNHGKANLCKIIKNAVDRTTLDCYIS